MINTKEINKLLGDKNMTIHDIAVRLGDSYSNTLFKINGRLCMSLMEAERIQLLLGIADCDFGFYFLGHTRGECQC